MNSTGHLSLPPDLISRGKLLQRSLHAILLNQVREGSPASIQAFATVLDTAPWALKRTLETPRELPEPLVPSLSQALDAAPRTNQHLVSILEVLRTLLPHVTWINRQAHADQDGAFVERHRHGMIVGSEGLFECSTLTLGLALMMPETCYPYHQHPPAEFYLVLSPGDWYREDVGWWSPGAGGLVFNPPSCVHAMKSRCVPLLALWGLLHSEAEL
ncbi:dimethylsulfonioproprionate lyase family protein [Pseudomonas sp. OA65]|uniref:dimethylsulfonioproprionate lyase family protein n=1 Tax=Pseudomonas sp. OA65 TaxID=2818431 RepID=UPI001FB138B5|nr:dimethylsulfonioproprionate lyase family protein [Pseudomonas sp. OA65]